jgi:putative hydrolase of the HAD superfamily
VKEIKHIIFDLDHTLWDFNRNSRETLIFLFSEYQLDQLLSTSFEDLLKVYYRVTNKLWAAYDKKEVSKSELRRQRLPQVFAHFDYINKTLAEQVESHYLSICPNKPHLIKGAIEVLNQLKKQNYPLYLLTNGFVDIQHKKITASAITHYFDLIVTSECSGFSKPDRRAFFHLLDQINATPKECLMIGDNLVSDIEGSSAIGMKNIFYNPEKTKHQTLPTFEISELEEILTLI